MSNMYTRSKSLAGIDITNYSVTELKAIVRAILEQKIHGISFSPYIEGQGPGVQIKCGPDPRTPCYYPAVCSMGTHLFLF